MEGALEIAKAFALVLTLLVADINLTAAL